MRAAALHAVGGQRARPADTVVLQPAHQLDVGSHSLGHPRQRVHAADARGQHGVGGVLAELGAARRLGIRCLEGGY